MCFDRGAAFACINFGYQPQYRQVMPLRQPGSFRLVLNSESARFGGVLGHPHDQEGHVYHSVYYEQLEPWQRNCLNGF